MNLEFHGKQKIPQKVRADLINFQIQSPSNIFIDALTRPTSPVCQGNRQRNSIWGHGHGNNSHPEGILIFGSDLMAISQDPSPGMQRKDSRAPGSTDCHAQLSAMRTEKQPPNTVLQTCHKAPAMPAPSRAALQAGDPPGMCSSSLAPSCSHTGTKLLREQKPAFQAPISSQAHSAGSHKACGAVGPRGEEALAASLWAAAHKPHP